MPSRGFAKVFVLKAGEEIRIEPDTVRRVMRPARPAVIAERLPKALVAQVVERLSESRPSTPTFLHDGPVGIETQAQLESLAQLRALEFSALGQVEDAKKKERLVRRIACRAVQLMPADCRVKLAQLAQPITAT